MLRLCEFKLISSIHPLHHITIQVKTFQSFALFIISVVGAWCEGKKKKKKERSGWNEERCIKKVFTHDNCHSHLLLQALCCLHFIIKKETFFFISVEWFFSIDVKEKKTFVLNHFKNYFFGVSYKFVNNVDFLSWKCCCSFFSIINKLHILHLNIDKYKSDFF